jgi:hypothetical protein
VPIYCLRTLAVIKNSRQQSSKPIITARVSSFCNLYDSAAIEKVRTFKGGFKKSRKTEDANFGQPLILSGRGPAKGL